jgi:hypothetical protein
MTPVNRGHWALVTTEFLTAPQEGTLKMLNGGLIALGIIGVVFGIVSFCRGLESDLSFGSLVCATGLGGRVLAARSDFAR